MLIGTPFRFVLIQASAAAYNALRPILVPRFEILFWLPLNLPDSLTELSIPKNATRCLVFRKPLISPISAINVIAVKRPIPGIESINSILFLICSEKLGELIKDSIYSSRFLISASRVFIIFIVLVILTENPCSGSPIIVASFA